MKSPKSPLISGIIPLFLLFFLLSSCDKKVTTLVWESQGDTYHFAESNQNRPNLAVCFSGGGTRAYTCATGQMHGLKKMKCWDGIGHISSVSGGTWASVVFTYYNASGNASNDDELLGTTHSPDKLTLDKLKEMEESFMGYAATQSLLDEILNPDFPLEGAGNWWIDGVGRTFLQPFGIYDPHKPRYFSYDTASAKAIMDRNPDLKLSLDDFYLVHVPGPKDVNRPYLVMNSAIVGPVDEHPFEAPLGLVNFNYTPLYVGQAYGSQVDFHSRLTGEKHNVGGGFIEPFAFGSKAPKMPPSVRGGQEKGVKSADLEELPENRYQLADAAGTSSAAYAATVSATLYLDPFLNGMLPEATYWPVFQNEVIKEKRYEFADGGSLENLGVITMLQRKVGKLLVFLNSPTSLDTTYDPNSGPPTNMQVDSDLNVLFGYFDGTPFEVNDQVFHSSDYATVVNGLIEKKKKGETIMTRTKLKTKGNTWWGIEEGQEVEIMWVYNDVVMDWQSQLPQATQDAIAEGENGPFPNFPLYKTVDENGFLRLVQLTNQQVNLLYELSAWNVYHNDSIANFVNE